MTRMGDGEPMRDEQDAADEAALPQEEGGEGAAVAVDDAGLQADEAPAGDAAQPEGAQPKPAEESHAARTAGIALAAVVVVALLVGAYLVGHGELDLSGLFARQPAPAQESAAEAEAEAEPAAEPEPAAADSPEPEPAGDEAAQPAAPEGEEPAADGAAPAEPEPEPAVPDVPEGMKRVGNEDAGYLVLPSAWVDRTNDFSQNDIDTYYVVYFADPGSADPAYGANSGMFNKAIVLQVYDMPYVEAGQRIADAYAADTATYGPVETGEATVGGRRAMTIRSTMADGGLRISLISIERDDDSSVLVSCNNGFDDASFDEVYGYATSWTATS